MRSNGLITTKQNDYLDTMLNQQRANDNRKMDNIIITRKRQNNAKSM